jgi:predicted homoserine dehydrogenase-like protein
VVSINAEVDAAIGWLLHAVAAAHGGVYTICDGDQPGVLMRTLDRVQHMAFDVVAAVNCKRHLDVHQSVAASAPYAKRDATSIAVTVSAGDGTKMNLEQAVVANLAGLPPDCRGMHGVPTVLERALPDVLGAISRDGVVEYTLGGDFGAGVFVIARAPEPDVVRTPLRFFKLGDGPEYLVFSPYTLVHFEMPRSIAEVALDDTPLWSPVGPPVADVVAIAKRDLAAGERLDGIGGDTAYGQIDTVDGARGVLPIAFAEHARVVKPVRGDDPIPLDAIELDAEAPIVALRRRQDALLEDVGA